MGNNDNQDRERAVRDRIADFIHADDQAQRKHATNEELQTLQDAVGRLDQLLTDAAAEESVQSTTDAPFRQLGNWVAGA
jgi:hypothetical protein